MVKSNFLRNTFIDDNSKFSLDLIHDNLIGSLSQKYWYFDATIVNLFMSTSNNLMLSNKQLIDEWCNEMVHKSDFFYNPINIISLCTMSIEDYNSELLLKYWLSQSNNLSLNTLNSFHELYNTYLTNSLKLQTLFEEIYNNAHSWIFDLICGIPSDYESSSYFEINWCINGCSGYQAWYTWASDNIIRSTSNCTWNSESFVEWCIAYVLESSKCLDK